MKMIDHRRMEQSLEAAADSSRLVFFPFFTLAAQTASLLMETVVVVLVRQWRC